MQYPRFFSWRRRAAAPPTAADATQIPRALEPRLVGATATIAALLGLRVATQAIALLLVVRLLGPNFYGSYVAPAALAVVLGILSTMGAGLIMMVRAPKGSDAVADVWSYAWPLTVAVGAILFALYLPAAHYIGGTSRLDIPILALIGITELLAIPLVGLLSQSLQACDKVPLSQFVLWIPMGLRVAAVPPCFFTSETNRIFAFVGLQFVATLLGLVFAFSTTKRHVDLGRTPRRVRSAEFKDGFAYAIKHLIAVNSSEIDKMLSVRILGSHDAGIYAASSRILAATVTPVIAVLLAAQPKLFRHAADSNAASEKLIRQIAFLALAWGIFACSALNLGKSLIPQIFGNNFSPVADLIPWLALVAVPLSLRMAASTILVVLGRPTTLVFFEIFGIGLLLISIFLLAPAWGMRGLACASLIGEAGMASVGWLLIYKYKQNQSLSRIRTS